MKYYHFAIAADWKYDRDFINLLEYLARQRDLTTYIIWPHNLAETVHQLKNREMDFGFFFDRASDTSPEFLALQQLIRQKSIPILDPWYMMKWAADKANMQFELERAGINTPYTIIVPPLRTEQNICCFDEELHKLGTPFIIKPANTSGGGIGVETEAQGIANIQRVRQMFPGENYLLQKKIIPLERDGRRFWFRGFYTCGFIQAVWWNDLDHLYDILRADEIEKYHLRPVFNMVQQIARICRLHFFSTEITMDSEGNFFVIDYVNDVCDMRLKSRFLNGVPNEVVEKIAGRIVEFVSEKLKYRIAAHTVIREISYDNVPSI